MNSHRICFTPFIDSQSDFASTEPAPFRKLRGKSVLITVIHANFYQATQWGPYSEAKSAESSRMFSRIQVHSAREIDAMAGQFAFEIKLGFLIINILKWHGHFG